MFDELINWAGLDALSDCGREVGITETRPYLYIKSCIKSRNAYEKRRKAKSNN